MPDLARAALARQGRKEGREIRFLCPAHDDRHPSARWNSDKRTWYCDACRAGGGWRDLGERLGLLDRRRESGNEVAAYRYRDAGGRLLYEVIRKEPKSFACRRPDGAGGWVWNLAGVERVLYRLPEIRAAVERGEAIWVVEGEKDVEALVALGLEATTNPGGAGKWRPQYGEPLRGARVYVIADHDEAGERHAREVAQGLAALAAEVRVVDLPELPAKGDVSDWIASARARGGKRQSLGAELLRLVATAPAWQGTRARGTAPAVRSRRVSEVAPERVSFLWRPYIPLGKVTLLEGDPGVGKSWIAAALAASGSLGVGLPGMEAGEPFGSLFFSAEDGLADTLRPRLDAMGADCARIFAHDEPVALDHAEGLAELERELVERRPRLVVLDPVVAYLSARTDLYRANEVRSVLAPLARLAQQQECAIVAVRHVNKAKGGRSIYAGQGSIDFTAAARSVLLAGSAGDDPNERALIHIKSNLAAAGPALGYRIERGRFVWTGESALTAGDVLAAEAPSEERSAEQEARAFLRAMLEAGPLPSRSVQAAAQREGISERTLKRAKQREQVEVRREGFGAAGIWIWSLPGRGLGDHRGPKKAIEGHICTWPPMEKVGPLCGEEARETSVTSESSSGGPEASSVDKTEVIV